LTVSIGKGAHRYASSAEPPRALVALQPVSLEGLVGLNVALGVSALKLGAPR
jgi:hypothetical protein